MTAAFPLQWPAGWKKTEADKRKSSSPFSTTYERALKHLLNELRLLGARNIVVSSNIPIRQDGMPFADAARRRIDDPGVAVYFSRGQRPTVMARDAYWSVHDNLRSIGLAVEHLRGMERHGGAQMMDRAFEGFTAIAPTSARTWRQVLGIGAGAPVDRAFIESCWREAAKRAHPDVGGSTEAMAAVNAAREAALKEITR